MVFCVNEDISTIVYYKLNDHDAWNGDDDEAGASGCSTTYCPWNAGALKRVARRRIAAKTRIVVPGVEDDGARGVGGSDTEAVVAATVAAYRN